MPSPAALSTELLFWWGLFLWRRLFFRGVDDTLWSNAGAVLHIDNVTVFGESIHKSGRQVIVLQELSPFRKAQVGTSAKGRVICATFTSLPRVHLG